jgi:hypothetical protein
MDVPVHLVLGGALLHASRERRSPSQLMALLGTGGA